MYHVRYLKDGKKLCLRIKKREIEELQPPDTIQQTVNKVLTKKCSKANKIKLLEFHKKITWYGDTT